MEARDLREENKFLISEFDRLIKEKGELLSKVSGSHCGTRMDGVTEGKVNEQNIEVSRPDGNCLDCKFQYREDSDYWCSICPGNP
jgi:hypothetical protein